MIRVLSGGLKMDKIVINGGNCLIGEVNVEGVKNVVLFVFIVLLFVFEGYSKLVNVLELSDVEIINNVLFIFNVNVEYDKDKNVVKVDVIKILNEEVFYEYVSKMWVSILVMGLLFVWLGYVIVVLLGGCVIGICFIE